MLPPDSQSSLERSLTRCGTSIARILSIPSYGNSTVASKPLTMSSNLEIQAHQSFQGLKLNMEIFSIKHSSRKPFMEETREDFTESLETYVGGAFTFVQESLKGFFQDHGETGLADGGKKKGTLVFTGTLGALRCSAQFAAHGAGRSSVGQLAQTLAREMSEKGVHVGGKKMSADAVGETYLWLHQQKPCLWTHGLDMRPAYEKFQ
ncbi:oxidoreductase domain-containing protein [Amniculicola lignicola CBS 123094]|uniref:Oxidoreductase domain-containing protein n=1 Tax=Amniculicola lignicola CBS 123094 TaxID=1392246 RepID=A0A6A5WTW7_9PLEO|nr:oxidoreductase domain-containing protein [Amniculicola lignicola CBS 123094]